MQGALNAESLSGAATARAELRPASGLSAPFVPSAKEDVGVSRDHRGRAGFWEAFFRSVLIGTTLNPGRLSGLGSENERLVGVGSWKRDDDEPA